jgi:hypothetical protein
MSTYPTSPRSDFLDWCQVHEPIFTANAAAIGLTVAQAAAFKTKMESAREDLLEQETAKLAAKTATQVTSQAFNQLRTGAGDAVRSIRAFAELAANPATVYSLAQSPPPSQPTPQPPPAQPTDLTVTLDPSEGAIILRWKASNPTGASGTAYIIRRKLPTETEFQFIGVSGRKEFVDDTLVAGPDSVQYTVQGQRSDQSGPLSPVFTVNFGKLPSGRPTVTGVSARTADATWNVEVPAPSSNGNTKRRPARV